MASLQLERAVRVSQNRLSKTCIPQVKRIPRPPGTLDLLALKLSPEWFKPFLAEGLSIIGGQNLCVKAPIVSSHLAQLQRSGRLNYLAEGFSLIPELAFKLHVTRWLHPLG